MYFDSTIVLLLPAIAFAMYSQYKVKSAYSKFSKIKARKGFTGYEVAKKILNSNGLFEVEIEMTQGSLTDHYDPAKRVVRLSPEVYQGNSIASVSIAAHETGHAIQHKEKYPLLAFRSLVVPVVNIGSISAFPLVLIGLLIANSGGTYIGRMMMDLGIIFFLAVVIFHSVTLPVEFNASNRALKQIEELGIVNDEEMNGAKKVLSAAAMTYVAALATALAQLIRLIIIRERN